MVTLPGWVGVGEPKGQLGGIYAKTVTICPTQACTTPKVTYWRVVHQIQAPQGNALVIVRIDICDELPLVHSSHLRCSTHQLRPTISWLLGWASSVVHRAPRTVLRLQIIKACWPTIGVRCGDHWEKKRKRRQPPKTHRPDAHIQITDQHEPGRPGSRSSQ